MIDDMTTPKMESTSGIIHMEIITVGTIRVSRKRGIMVSNCR